MTRRTSRDLLFLLLIACHAWAMADGDPFGPVVTTEWLGAHLDDPDLVVLDASVVIRPNADGSMSSESGRAAFEAEHIPTAGFADLMSDLSDPDQDREFMAPSPAAFAEAMGSLGVGDETRVVLYDTYNSAWAARVWWMLRWVGFDNAAILDGGFRAWKAEGRPVSSEAAAEPIRKLTPKPRPDLFVDRAAVLAAVGNEAIRIIDAMPSQHYSGELAMYARPGHIESAENRSTLLLIDETGRFRSDDALAEIFDGDRQTPVITYCGGGIAASAVAFTMVRLGFADVRVYDASLEEWAADPTLPMAVSPEFDWSED